MGLLNYTTEIRVEKSVYELVGLLQSNKAKAIMQEFDAAANVTAISFRADTQFGEIAFRLPLNLQAVQQILKNQAQAGKIPRRFANDAEQARRVGWRILKDWTAAQLALVQIGMVKLEQVFLPYAQDHTGKTVFESLEEKKFSGLALPGKSA
jgi:hypothetical protein